MEELRLEIEEVAYDEALAEKNMEENGELFKGKITDGIGEDVEIDESEVE